MKVHKSAKTLFSRVGAITIASFCALACTPTVWAHSTPHGSEAVLAPLTVAPPATAAKTVAPDDKTPSPSSNLPFPEPKFDETGKADLAAWAQQHCKVALTPSTTNTPIYFHSQLTENGSVSSWLGVSRSYLHAPAPENYKETFIPGPAHDPVGVCLEIYKTPPLQMRNTVTYPVGLPIYFGSNYLGDTEARSFVEKYPQGYVKIITRKYQSFPAGQRDSARYVDFPTFLTGEHDLEKILDEAVPLGQIDTYPTLTKQDEYTISLLFYRPGLYVLDFDAYLFKDRTSTTAVTKTTMRYTVIVDKKLHSSDVGVSHTSNDDALPAPEQEIPVEQQGDPNTGETPNSQPDETTPHAPGETQPDSGHSEETTPGPDQSGTSDHPGAPAPDPNTQPSDTTPPVAPHPTHQEEWDTPEGGSNPPLTGTNTPPDTPENPPTTTGEGSTPTGGQVAPGVGTAPTPEEPAPTNTNEQPGEPESGPNTQPGKPETTPVGTPNSEVHTPAEPSVPLVTPNETEEHSRPQSHPEATPGNETSTSPDETDESSSSSGSAETPASTPQPGETANPATQPKHDEDQQNPPPNPTPTTPDEQPAASEADADTAPTGHPGPNPAPGEPTTTNGHPEAPANPEPSVPLVPPTEITPPTNPTPRAGEPASTPSPRPAQPEVLSPRKPDGIIAVPASPGQLSPQLTPPRRPLIHVSEPPYPRLAPTRTPETVPAEAPASQPSEESSATPAPTQMPNLSIDENEMPVDPTRKWEKQSSKYILISGALVATVGGGTALYLILGGKFFKLAGSKRGRHRR